MRVAILMRKAPSRKVRRCRRTSPSSSPERARQRARTRRRAAQDPRLQPRFSQKEINIGLAREALKDLLSIQNRQIGVENIQKTVADFYKIKVADMYSKEAPGLDRAAAPDRDVPGQGDDAEEPARDRRSCSAVATTPPCCTRCARSPASAEEQRTEPAAARAGTDAEGMSREGNVKAGTSLGTVPDKAFGGSSTGAALLRRVVCPRAAQTSGPGSRRTGFGALLKPLTEKAKIAFSQPPGPYRTTGLQRG